MPCLCDLTHSCAALERIRLVENDLYDKEVRRLYRRALAETSDPSSLNSLIERGIRTGVFPPNPWSDDWRVRFGLITDILRPHVIRLLFFSHAIFTPSLTRLSKLVSSSRIMEDIPFYFRGPPNLAVAVVEVGHYDTLNGKRSDSVTSVDRKELVSSIANSLSIHFR